ncbi:MAG TPA: pyruvate formate lyase family protein, partial [Anaerovoracaceae bacterium]|nr:pyruvate formate lyase family protein [Anaerovoracaceae bacterium]
MKTENEVAEIGGSTRSDDWHAGRGAECGSTERVRRLNATLNKATPCVDLHRARCFTEVYKNNEAKSALEKKALATYKTLATYEPYVEEDELIVGLACPKPKGHPMHPELDCWWIEMEGGLKSLATRAHNPFYATPEDVKEYEEEILPYWREKTTYAKWIEICPQEVVDRTFACGFAEASFDLCVLGSHECMDWPYILTYGMDSYREAAREKLAELSVLDPDNIKKIQYYKGVIMEIDGIEIFANNYSMKVKNMADAEKNPKRKAELERTAAACAQVPLHPARSFFEALQSIWLTFCTLPSDGSGPLYTIGHFDQILWPYYKHDIDEGIITRAEAQEMVECLWLKYNNTMFFTDVETARIFAGTAVFQNLQVGGMDRYGNDATNELSYVAIDAMIEVRTIQPSFSVRLHDGSPEEFRMKVMDLVAAGMGHPSIYNDNVAVKTMMMTGHDWHEANDYCCGGCMEIGRMGHFWWGPGVFINMGMAVELALNGGKKRDNTYGLMQGKQLSYKTPDPRTMKTYEEFEAAVITHIKAQEDYLYASCGAMLETYQDYPCILQSVLGGQGIERGLPFFGGGLDYSMFPGMSGVGMPDCGNSLAAVKKLVFDDKVITMSQLCDALDANFEGYEEIHQLCLNAPKYGNDDDYADKCTKNALDAMATYAKSRPGLLAKYDTEQATAAIRHQVGCALAPVSGNVIQGQHVGALPSGRKAMEPLGDSLGAYAGTDVQGPTATLKSVAKMGHERFHGTITNLYVTKNSVDNKAGRKRLSDMIKAYF